MNRKERLLATLAGNQVDRPAFSFYEINGLDENVNDPDPFNIYNHPSWKPVIELARSKTDRIVMRSVEFEDNGTDPLFPYKEKMTWYVDNRRYERTKIKTRRKELTATSIRDPDVNTIWQVEHLLKNVDDLESLIDLPFQQPHGAPIIAPVLEAEEHLGDSGIVMLDTPDPLCIAASLFDLGTFTIIATQYKDLFHQLLVKFSECINYHVENSSKILPGHLWRIYGPEYASPPYLNPRFFNEYVVHYDQPIVNAIQQHQGFARIHCHGRLKSILSYIANLNCDGLDPIEPPPQGDIELQDVRMRYGEGMVLFGNLEASDLETLPTSEFKEKIRKAIREGTSGSGRGFVLMPSSCPYGRVLPETAYRNYLEMVSMIESGNFY